MTRTRIGTTLTLATIALGLSAIGCADESRSSPDPAPAPASKSDDPLVTARVFPPTFGPPGREALLFGPADAAPEERLPLYILLHGYLDDAEWMVDFVRAEGFESRRRSLVLVPEGRRDWTGQRFWATGSACCNFHGAEEGADEELLVSLIDRAVEELGADPERVYVVGFSNGGFMAYTMACRHAERLAGVAVINGSSFAEPGLCEPSAPLHLLHVHATGDPRIEFGGGELTFYGGAYPGILELLARWAERGECHDTLALDAGYISLGAEEGEDAIDSSYRGCRPGSSVRLWELGANVHKPKLRADFLDVIGAYMDERHAESLRAEIDQ